MKRICPALLLLTVFCATTARPQSAAQTTSTTPRSAAARQQRARRFDQLKPPTQDDLLRGSYGPYRANNDLLFYALKLRVDPGAQTIKGSNTIRFRMLADGTRIQIDLAPSLNIDGITFKGKPLHYDRVPDTRALYIDFPETLRKGKTYDVVFAYSGHPVTQGRFGCFSFDKDKEGKPWITTACEGEGPSIWWPNKDQWKDEPQDGMQIDIAVPNGLMDVSNGRFQGTKDLGDGYTEWRWHVHYPINNYDVALNIGEYQHWSGLHVNKETRQKTTLDFYALPEDLAKAKIQFQQVPTMLDAYEHYFGEYPFDKDGYKLIEVPYSGMEHQTAVSYGNHFTNGYLGRDWAGVGISMKFDFIIIHESGHEWFGNSITAADPSDMWIHEGWTTYLETLYVEYRWGKADAIKYVNGLKPKIHNMRPIVAPRGTNAEPTEDQYFKGALMLNTLRSVIANDQKWFADIHDFYQHFKYQNIMTEDVVSWWNDRTGMNLTPFFNEYLRHAAIPVLELHFDPAKQTVGYRWKADEPAFAMPIEVGNAQHWTKITPTTTAWQTMPWTQEPSQLAVDTDYYYVDVNREAQPPTQSSTNPQ
ncbi:MAG TPA: M1 family metallopeptidase [Acidobacteriaceae bacterium]